MAEALVKGTIEYLIYDLVDRLQELDDLTPTNPRFDIFNPQGTLILANQPLVVPAPGMEVRALVDTTGVLYVAGAGNYSVYLRFDTSPETPYMHGGDFTITPLPG